MEDKNRDKRRLLGRLAKEREGLEGREVLENKIKTADEDSSELKAARRERKSQNLRLLAKLRQRAQRQREEILLREKERDQLLQRVHPDFNFEEKVPPDTNLLRL